MIKERIVNILKRMTFKHFVIIDIDNLNDNMVSATVQNSVTGQTYPVHFPLDMLELKNIYWQIYLKITTLQRRVSMENEKITSKEFLAILHRSYDKRLSFNNFIKRLRKDIALEYEYIMSAVDYDSIVLDLVDLGEIDNKVLLNIKLKGDTNNEV